MQSQVPEDLLDHRLFRDRRDDLQLAAAVRAARQVDLESEASAKTNLYSSYVAAKTRLSSLAQLSRTGPVMRAVRLAFDGLCGLRRRLGPLRHLLRHHQRAQLGRSCR